MRAKKSIPRTRELEQSSSQCVRDMVMLGYLMSHFDKQTWKPLLLLFMCLTRPC
jgi:hypothetical protein